MRLNRHTASLPLAPSIDGLDVRESHFVAELLALGGRPEDGAEAALRAGYAGTQQEAALSAKFLLIAPRIRKAIKSAVTARFEASAGAFSAVILGLAQGAKSEQVRLAAAREGLDRAGMVVASRTAAAVNVSVTHGVTADLLAEIRREKDMGVIDVETSPVD